MPDNRVNSSDIKMGQKDINITTSKFTIKSIGYAAHNLPLDSHKLEIVPVESVGYVDGEMTDETETFEEKGVDQYGNSYSVKVETSNCLVAEWLQWGTNRVTAPNVRRGERVVIWQYADTDKYYWSSLGMDDHLRRLETVIFAFSNTKDESTKLLTKDNSYYFEIDTHKKLITLSTSKSDGEPYAYNIQINTKDGIVLITDDNNNQFSIESKERRLAMQNADGCRLTLDKKNGSFDIPETMDYKCKTFNASASDSFNVQTKSINMQADNASINANTALRGSLTSNGKNISDSHRHKGVQSGKSTSGSVS